MLNYLALVVRIQTRMSWLTLKVAYAQITGNYPRQGEILELRPEEELYSRRKGQGGDISQRRAGRPEQAGDTHRKRQKGVQRQGGAPVGEHSQQLRRILRPCKALSCGDRGGYSPAKIIGLIQAIKKPAHLQYVPVFFVD